jgi:hypothetical protein
MGVARMIRDHFDCVFPAFTEGCGSRDLRVLAQKSGEDSEELRDELPPASSFALQRHGHRHSQRAARRIFDIFWGQRTQSSVDRKVVWTSEMTYLAFDPKRGGKKIQCRVTVTGNKKIVAPGPPNNKNKNI